MLERPRIIDVERKPNKCPVCGERVVDILRHKLNNGDWKELASYDYNSLGQKVSETLNHSLAMNFSYNLRGWLTGVSSSIFSETRRYTGNLMEETGKADRLYNETGYIDIANDGSYSYHFYIKDPWGSIRAVVNENATLDQADDYTDSGLPYNANPFLTVDNRKHTGKEFEAFNGLAWYDNNARWYDPILVRFTTMDPMAESYYHLTPYNYCAGNHLRFCDPTGNVIKASIWGKPYYYTKSADGGWRFIDDHGAPYSNDGDSDFLMELTAALEKLQQGLFGDYLVSFIADHPKEVTISYNTKNRTDIKENGDVIEWCSDLNEGGLAYYQGIGYSPNRPSFIGLGHELAHVFDDMQGTACYDLWYELEKNVEITLSEVFASQCENVLRSEHGIPVRTHYSRTDSNVPIEKSHIFPPFPPMGIYPYSPVFSVLFQK